MARTLATAGWSAALVALAMVVAACGGGTPRGPLPQVRSAEAERIVVDGAAQVASRVTVRFDRDITLAGDRIPLASHFELDIEETLRQAGGITRVLVRSAEAQDDGRTIVLEVDRIIPDGAKLRVAKRAFQVGAAGELSAVISGDLSPEVALLAGRALGITRATVLAPPVARPAAPEDSDPAAMRALLEDHLRKRAADAETVLRAVAAFDAIPEATVPSPKLRSALAALTGTFAEPAIASLLTATNCTGKPAASVLFQPPPEAPDLFARATRSRDGARVISVNPSLAGDRIEHLMAILAHEAIHCDRDAGRAEEVASTAFDTLLYLQLVAVMPEIVDSGTPLARDLNVDVVAMINSGRRLPESIGLLRSAGVAQALPGTNSPYASFADLVAAAYPTLEGVQSVEEPLAVEYVARLAARAGVAPGPAFDLRYLDELFARSVDLRTMATLILAFELAPAG
ncbi:MAG: hypothetical protein ACR2HN_10510 [Tepidiformaceae bacterium]